jgi:alpha-tubulin suppressor-like RCC1 family protein
MGLLSSTERIFKYPVTFPPRLSSNEVNVKTPAPKQAMKNKDYTLFGIPLAVLLIGLISSPAWAAPAAGKIIAWGSNQYGQTNVPAGNDFVAIDAGRGYHGLALRSDGSLAGWGWNYGDKDLGTYDIFYGQAIVPAGNDFKAIAAGATHSLALKTDGSLVAWGSNTNQDGNFAGQATVPTGNDFVAIAAGDFYSLALKSDGSLVAWGDNSTGQTNVPSGNDFVAIGAGDSFGLSLKSDGSLVAWGEDNVMQVSDVPSGNDFATIAAGWGDDLVLKSDGSLVGWGWNNNGQTNVPSGNGFVAIAAGWQHSLALKSDGSLVGWGWNYGDAESGTLGTFYGQATPPAGTNFVAISAGWEYSLAIQVVIEPPVLNIARVGNSVVLSWSANDSGYTLEASADLSSSLNWSNVFATPAIVGTQYTITNGVANSYQFYRLRK